MSHSYVSQLMHCVFQKKDFKSEFISFLDKHFIEYGARFVFDRAFSAVPTGLTV